MGMDLAFDILAATLESQWVYLLVFVIAIFGVFIFVGLFVLVILAGTNRDELIDALQEVEVKLAVEVAAFVFDNFS